MADALADALRQLLNAHRSAQITVVPRAESVRLAAVLLQQKSRQRSVDIQRHKSALDQKLKNAVEGHANVLLNLAPDERVKLNLQSRDAQVGISLPILARRLPHVAEDHLDRFLVEHGIFFLLDARLRQLFQRSRQEQRIGYVGGVERMRIKPTDIVLELVGDLIGILA